MPRSTLPKAYLRVDPNLDHAKPGHLAVFVRLLCLASRQPVRGRFKNRRLLEQILGRAAAKRVVDEGDVVPASQHAECRDCPDGHGAHGQLYVVGWDEWQEGDLTVGERQRRIRSRRHVTPESRERNGDVTDQSLPNRDGPPSTTTSRGSSDRAEGVGREASANGADLSLTSIEAALSRLMRRSPSPGQLTKVEEFDEELPDGIALATIENLIDDPPAKDRYGVLLQQLTDAKRAMPRNGRGASGKPGANSWGVVNDYDALAEGSR